jgi:hypothetical protein
MHEPGVITLDSVDTLREQAIWLGQQAQRQLTLFTPDLEPALYDNDDFVSAALDLIKRSKHTQVRILTQDTRHAQECGHGLLKLLRYGSPQFQLRKLTVDVDHRDLAYLISDDKHLLRRQSSKAYQGLCYTHDRARARDQLEDFDLLWNAAIIDPNLRNFTL